MRDPLRRSCTARKTGTFMFYIWLKAKKKKFLHLYSYTLLLLLILPHCCWARSLYIFSDTGIIWLQSFFEQLPQCGLVSDITERHHPRHRQNTSCNCNCNCNCNCICSNISPSNIASIHRKGAALGWQPVKCICCPDPYILWLSGHLAEI